MILRILFTLFLSANIAWASAAAKTSADIYPFYKAQKQTQFNHLLTELRCLVCQNQDLADSNAKLAKDLRKQVYQLVQLGKTDAQIKTYLTNRYGDFILFKPPVNEQTYFLWFGPFVILLIGFFILIAAIRRNKHA